MQVSSHGEYRPSNQPMNAAQVNDRYSMYQCRQSRTHGVGEVQILVCAYLEQTVVGKRIARQPETLFIVYLFNNLGLNV